MSDFNERVTALKARHEVLLSRKNNPLPYGNGIYEKYENPIITAERNTGRRKNICCSEQWRFFCYLG